MKTDELINALVADLPMRSLRMAKLFVLAVMGGAAISGAIFFLWIHPRPDFMQAATTVRFLFKFVVTLLLAGAAFGLLGRLAQPGAPLGLWRVGCFAAPALLVLAVVTELLVAPSDSWAARLIGANAKYCLSLIPLLALAPLVAIFVALREGAPTQPRLVGAVAGLAAGGVAAAMYAAHCTDDSPLFVAIWYSIAIGIVTFVGAAAGPRFLRW